MTVGVIVRWAGPAGQRHVASARDLAFYHRIAADRGLDILALDWRSVTADGQVTAQDVRGGTPHRTPLQRFGLIHVAALGAAPGGSEPLRDKWAQLRGVLAVLRAAAIPCINLLETLAYGIEKSYLLALRDAGIPVIPSRIVAVQSGLAGIRAARSGPAEHIVKPLAGECGRGLCRLSELDAGRLRVLARHGDAVLVQPFMREIADGERSLVFVDGQLAHAVRKVSAPGDYRTNGPHVGAAVRPYDPPGAELGFARRAIAAFPRPIDLGRVDYVVTARGPLIMELEVIDPGLYRARTLAFGNSLGALYASRLKSI